MKTFKEIYSEDSTTEQILLGGDPRHGEVRLKSAAGNEIVVLRADKGELTLGGTDINGDIILKAAGNDVVTIHAEKGELTLGGANVSGDIILKIGDGTEAVSLHADSGQLTLGAKGVGGDIVLKNSNNRQTGTIEANTAKLTLGYGDLTPSSGGEVITGLSGEIILNYKTAKLVSKTTGGKEPHKGVDPVPVEPEPVQPYTLEQVAAISLDGENANLTMGCVGADGDIILRNSKGTDAIILDADTGNLRMGGDGADGDIILTNNKGNEAINLNADGSSLTLGSPDYPGQLILKDKKGTATVSLEASNGILTLGGVGVNGDISIKNNVDNETIHIDGAAGDINFLNADVAEEFDVSENAIEESCPGTVMVLNDDGKLVPCCKEYDSRVVGVIAGAGRFKPGIVMDRTGGKNRLSVAIMGKVHCKADARENTIEVGDLLTTGRSNGHAVKVKSKIDAFGAVIGKALERLPDGTGLIPILVNLK